MFSSQESQQGVGNGQDSRGICLGYTGLWTTGCWLARQLRPLKASTAMDLDTTFSCFCVTSVLEKLGLVDQN